MLKMGNIIIKVGYHIELKAACVMNYFLHRGAVLVC